MLHSSPDDGSSKYLRIVDGCPPDFTKYQKTVIHVAGYFKNFHPYHNTERPFQTSHTLIHYCRKTAKARKMELAVYGMKLKEFYSV
jgi:hypothetical protein